MAGWLRHNNGSRAGKTLYMNVGTLGGCLEHLYTEVKVCRRVSFGSFEQ